ncbi:amino acid ABC transporter permease [Acuticoccus sp. MNP-M23]|uniref:amino acid ABC transporter permease n=1 Tax=Acuticoccus sp. MNP-M23 TaxID=3072793 RepID=UPI00281612DE|nr:amino acid ABC transporter permease [Acuticoccus sp. MNP-M23]WMS40885.1 amino acid ABC transporter permease [Acuticoccus sp. MNP-M23]
MSGATLSTETIAAAPPPPEDGAVAWARRRLFSNAFDTVITLVFGALVVWLAVVLVDWAFIGAIWNAADAELCRSANGACWAVIDARGRLILFGLYPYEEQWRSALACLVIIVTMILSCVPHFWGLRALPTIWLTGFGIFVALMYGGFLGLPLVTTEQWGGLALTVFIFAAVFVIGMPLAVALALARRSNLPVIRAVAAFLIDTVRSLPLLTILFAAAVVVPFVVPDWAQGDKLGRVVVAFALFFACYEAEILRSGLQSIPGGQEEAAAALGMSYSARVFDILLPQAFRASLPATINQVVITFKETSIVTIIGFFEVTASASAAVGRGEWGAYYVEVYVFVALVYFVFVFGLSRYGAYLERRARLTARG